MNGRRLLLYELMLQRVRVVKVFVEHALVECVHDFDLLVVQYAEALIEREQVQVNAVHIRIELQLQQFGVMTVVHVGEYVEHVFVDLFDQRVELRRKRVAHFGRKERLVADQLGNVGERRVDVLRGGVFEFFALLVQPVELVAERGAHCRTGLECAMVGYRTV